MKKIIHLGTTAVAIKELPQCTPAERKKTESVAALELVRHLTGSGDTTITHDNNGKPHIIGAYISISHSPRAIAVAIDTTRPIGIDIEENRTRQLTRAATRFLTDQEAADATAQPLGLLRAWTLKEAAYKCIERDAPADLRRIALKDINILTSEWLNDLAVWMSVVTD